LNEKKNKTNTKQIQWKKAKGSDEIGILTIGADGDRKWRQCSVAPSRQWRSPLVTIAAIERLELKT
jgi:hypothetical protein